MEMLEELLIEVSEYAALIFNYVALALCIYFGVKGIIALFKKQNVALVLLKGFSEGLTFLLGAEILHTIVLKDAKSLLVVAGVTAVRVVLSILIHWEMHQEAHE